jgi:hypothetical protein
MATTTIGFDDVALTGTIRIDFENLLTQACYKWK